MTDSYELSEVEREINERGSFASVTKGPSMRPLFKTNRDMIVVAKIEAPLKKYDIILYRGGSGEYILHRIIGIRDDFFVVRGDNNYFKERVPKEAAIGVLVAYNRKGKHGSPSTLSFKLYSRLWRYIYPIRFLFAKVRLCISRIIRKKCGKP